MQGLSTFAAAVHGVGPALASVALISALAAQEPRKRLPPPKPSSQCYAIRPDTGSRPWFLPEHLVLGANPVGDIGFRAAAVSPDRIRETYPDREDTLYARWSAYRGVVRSGSRRLIVRSCDGALRRPSCRHSMASDTRSERGLSTWAVASCLTTPGTHMSLGGGLTSA